MTVKTQAHENNSSCDMLFYSESELPATHLKKLKTKTRRKLHAVIKFLKCCKNSVNIMELEIRI